MTKQAEYVRKYRENNPEKVKAQLNLLSHKRKTIPEYRVRKLLVKIRHRSKKEGEECNLTIEDFLPLPELCPVLGILLDYSGGAIQDNRVSVDRADRTKGYVKGNCYLVSFRANRLKCNATYEELQKVADYTKLVSNDAVE